MKDLSGDWIFEFNQKLHGKEINLGSKMVLTQFDSQVQGRVELSVDKLHMDLKSVLNKSNPHRLILKGELINNSILRIAFYNENRALMQLGSFMLRVDGTEPHSGHFVANSLEHDEIITGKLTLRRR